jgi:hypothetical protein
MKRVLLFYIIALIIAVMLGFCLWSTNDVSVISAEVSAAAFTVFCPAVLKKLPGNAVKTPCPIVYMEVENDKVRLYTLPYLDLCRRDDVWGILVNGIMVQATDAPGTSLAAANDYATKTSEAYFSPIGMPSSWQAICLMLGHKKFEHTVQILNQCGIEAEGFAFGDYWCDCKKPTLVYLNGKKSGRKLANPFRHTKYPQRAHHVRLLVK